eukprot:gene16152-16330_t
MEKDEFDEKNAYYIIAKDENGVVRGCQRLIEMTNPCMLDGSFSGLLTSLKDFKHAGYWEASRFAVDHMYDESYTLKDSQILVPTLLAGVMEFGLQIEKVECFLTLSFPGVAKLAALYGLLMAPLKQSEISGETVVISGYPPLNAMETITATKASILGVLEPLATVVIGILFLDETITLRQWMGTGIVLAGALLVQCEPYLRAYFKTFRMIVQDADFLLLDEPFAAVDEATTKDLLKLIQEWHCQGKSIVAVIHNLNLGLDLIHDLVICPPFTLLTEANKNIHLSKVSLGAQDCHQKPLGAFTGNISADQYHGENNDLVKVKAETAILSGLKPIICVGENLAEREQGSALEPVWAIGTGKAASLKDIEEVHSFLRRLIGPYIPLLYGDMDKAIERTIDAIEKKQPIVVYGDYDVDGATSSALLRRYFKDIGYPIQLYIPDRIEEGYGANKEALELLYRQGQRLVLMVDSGTTAFEPLEHAHSLGLDVIILDHHTAQPALPKSIGIVNPNRLDQDLGLSVKRVGFLIRLSLTYFTIWILLLLERAFVTQGLKILKQRQNPGLSILSDIAGVNETISTYHLGFILGPRINAGEEGWHPGVIGIVASRLKERYNRPACVIGFENGIGKGSGRSITGVELGAAMHIAVHQSLLEKGGGHAMAAGFTVHKDKYDLFHTFLNNHLGKQISEITPTLKLDGYLSIGAATEALLQTIGCLEPFGNGNASPKFAFNQVRVAYIDTVGENHLRCQLADEAGNRLKAMAFRAKNTPLGRYLEETKGERIQVAGTLKVDSWQGSTNVSFIIEDAMTA